MERLKQLWRSWPLRVKLIVMTTVLVVLVAVSITLLSIYFEQRAFRTDWEQQAELLLDTLEISVVDALYYLDADHLSDVMEALGEDEVLVAGRVYDRDGRIIADAYSEGVTYDLQSDPLGRQLLDSQGTLFIWQSDQLLAGRAVRVGSQRLGAISVGLPTASLETKIDAMRVRGLAVAVAAIAMGMLLALFVSRSITYKLQEMVEMTEGVAAGDLTGEIAVRGNDELAVLARAFNAMTAQLAALIQSLEQRSQELESSQRLTFAVSELSKATLDPELLLREAVQLLQSRFALSRVHIYLLSEMTRRLVVYAATGESGEAAREQGYSISLDEKDSPVTQAARSQEAVLRDVSGPQVHCEVAVPMVMGGKLLGVLHVQDDCPSRFKQSDLETFGVLAGQIATALENALLFEQLYAAKESSEAASRAKSTFLANISHELRTPLTSVLGFAKISKKRLEEVIFPQVSGQEPKVRRAIDQVTANMDVIVLEGERLTTLINDVLDLAKIEAGKIEWHMELVSVEEVVEWSVEATDWMFEKKPLKFELDVETGLPLVLGDRNRLAQVMINLISNAVKFTDEGSVTCRVRQEGDEIVVSVIDTGIGVEPKNYNKLFDPFVQVGDSLTDKPRGTGLGLPICKYIVEHHGGRIWVESEGVPGQGTNFSFALPVAQPPVDSEDED
jgi:signal transduction histidine kinase/HAMP domain-containing protein